MKTAPDSKEDSAIQNVRRRHPRYRYSVPFTIRRGEGPAIPAISLEISESGISALVGDQLKVGDQVELEPIGGGKMTAVVRHNTGMLYGFEFVNPSSEQIRKIAERCEMLPQFRTKALGI
jgi:hypothetical protein